MKIVKPGIILFLTALIFSTQALACHHFKRVSPKANCATYATHSALPTYYCCGLSDKKGKHIWKNQWVSGSCKNANINAHYDARCKTNSFVYGTKAPIPAMCQFSRHVKGK